ncbi:DYH1B-like protein [Mya arenaria]|uniref:DYH1B-like protein n=1 Tax=Mya arenaria TaxID=6604 RepID=A0ABY7ECD8_MYAAR|nr:DYH1B-like protein [Mya arenaria]
MDVTQPDMSEATTDSGEGSSEPPLAINYKSPQSFLHTAIVSTMKQVPPKVWEAVLQESQAIRNIAFSISIIQAMLVARQLFGAQGLSQFYPFSNVQTGQAITLVVYENTAFSEFDQAYVVALVRSVIHNIYTDSSGTLVLGTVAIPTPPANTAMISCLYNFFNSSSTKFIQNMDHMFETQNMEAGEVSITQENEVNVKHLRSSLDLCVEELPPLLELGSVPESTQNTTYNFPYHRPSVISIATASSTFMPETLGYECLWLNSLLCHIRQQISELQDRLLSGPEALPLNHMASVLSLQEEHVPVSWVHPNSQPSTHSLVSWLEDMMKRYNQLHTFVKCGMVPTFTDGVIGDNPVIGHGHLNKLWLGGLVNPEALLTALKQEKAVVSQCSLEDVGSFFFVRIKSLFLKFMMINDNNLIVFECVVLDSDSTTDYDVDEGGLFITNVHLQGAAWDYDNDCLQDATVSHYPIIACFSSALFNIPSIYLKPVLRSESPDQETQENRNKKIYTCPMFMNRSRQYQVSELQLNCPPPVDTWYLARVALVLDAGLPEDGVKKSRSYLMNLRPQAIIQDEQEPEDEESEEELDELEPDDESDAEEIGGHSEPSQLSYRPMSPKAPPLPPGLGLLREPPMAEEEQGSAKSKGGKNSPANRKTPTRKTPSRTPPKTTPRKTPSLPTFPEGEQDGQKTQPKGQSPVGAMKTPSPPAGPRKTPSPRQTSAGRLSRIQKQGSASKGRTSRGSKKEFDGEEENRPFSQAHEEPVTQVEVENGDETGGDPNVQQQGSVDSPRSGRAEV